MNLFLLGRIIGLYALIFGATLTSPILVGLWYREPEVLHFLWPMAGSIGFGTLLWLIGRQHSRELSVGDGYLIVTLRGPDLAV